MQESRLPILKFSRDNKQSNLLDFLTSKTITLQYSRDILGIFLKQTFVECSWNILQTLLRDYWNFPKDQYLILSNHTLFNTKTTFQSRNFLKTFSLKFSLNVPSMSQILQHWGVLSEYSWKIASRLGSFSSLTLSSFAKIWYSF